MHAATLARRLPWSLVVISVLLVVLGLIGIARAEELAGSSGRFLRAQFVWCALAGGLVVVCLVPSYRRPCGWAYVAFAGVLVLLVLVYFFRPINGAHRWIRVGPVGLQPSELAKVVFVLALARYLMYRENFRKLRGLLLPLGMALVPLLLILKEPDLGTSLVFLPVLFVMLFAAGARKSDLAKVLAVGLLVLPVLWTQMSREQRSRVTALWEQNAPDQRPSDDGYHLHQAKQMVALGGVWGSWLQGDVVDDRDVYRLPDARTDFVFCVIGERLGLPGMMAMFVLYGLFAWRGLAIASSTREPFGRLVAVGIVSLFAVEWMVNSSMTLGLAPITGMSLPLVSYGGSGLLAHAMALGLLLNIGLRPGYEVTKEPFRFQSVAAGSSAIRSQQRREGAKIPAGALRG